MAPISFLLVPTTQRNHTFCQRFQNRSKGGVRGLNGWNLALPTRRGWIEMKKWIKASAKSRAILPQTVRVVWIAQYHLVSCIRTEHEICENNHRWNYVLHPNTTTVHIFYKTFTGLSLGWSPSLRWLGLVRRWGIVTSALGTSASFAGDIYIL